MKMFNNTVMTSVQNIRLALLVALALPMASHAEEHGTTATEGKPFSSMAIAPDRVDECRVPRPPAELAETAYLRNGYRAILRILMAEQGLETEVCGCLLDQFTWDMALKNLERFQTSDNPRLPFKVLNLYAMADALEAERAEACTE